MNNRLVTTALLAAALGSGWVAPAGATMETRSTGVLEKAYWGYAVCAVTNTGDAAVVVPQVRVKNATGVVPVHRNNVALAPMETASVTLLPGNMGQFRCEADFADLVDAGRVIVSFYNLDGARSADGDRTRPELDRLQAKVDQLLESMAEPETTTLWAGPLNPTPAFLDCLASNVSDANLDITIEILSSSGASLGILSATVQPGRTFGTGVGVNNPRLCKFTFDGGPEQVRATACVSSDDRCDGSAVSAH